MPTCIVHALIVLPPEAGGPRVTPLRFDRARVLSLDAPPRRGDTILDLADRTVYPGLVNAHDHLEMNHYPRTKYRPVYENAHAWGLDFTPRLLEEPFKSLRQVPLADQCRTGGLKNLRSGVTAVAHHNPLHKPLRRGDFPVRVLQRYGWAHSLYFEKDVAGIYRRSLRDAPWMTHLAEGTDDEAASELRRLDDLGCLQDNTVLIHGVGLSAADRARAIEAGAGLVWCPSSNFFLLGQTADVRSFADAGRLALGTDSLLTADGDMLDELRCAAATGQLTPEQLFRAVTTGAARLLRWPDVGALLPGCCPDFFITRRVDDPYQTLIDLTPRDIEAVYIRGLRRHEGLLEKSAKTYNIG
ncbi:MAG TPA: amidohydrolase family protein [Aggregatilineales bacterium]|nr:amidohydrolase family protein [Aggregatilineales bacterium]